jgi:hypothetical protein
MRASLATDSFLTPGHYKVLKTYWKVEESLQKLTAEIDLCLNTPINFKFQEFIGLEVDGFKNI